MKQGMLCLALLALAGCKCVVPYGMWNDTVRINPIPEPYKRSYRSTIQHSTRPRPSAELRDSEPIAIPLNAKPVPTFAPPVPKEAKPPRVETEAERRARLRVTA